MTGRWAALACAALTLLSVAGGKRVPWWSIRISQQQGPHACVVEEVPGTYIELWTECRYWIQRKICGQKTLIRYECCEGYQQLGEDNGCTGVKPLKNILETAYDLGARRFVAAMKDSGMAEELAREGALTLFAPTDNAFARMPARLRSALLSGGADNAVLLYHLLDGKLTSSEMKADQLVATRSDGAKLRLNKYSNQLTTANCHLLLRKDQQATNGIVHVIDGVLDPASISHTPLVDLVAQDGRFTILAEALRRSGYEQKLRELRRSVTLLAPSDEAFQKLTRRQRENILNDTDAAKALLKNHVVSHPICKSAIMGDHKIKSKTGNRLTFHCDRDAVFVERSEVRGEEIMAEDGVIHLLDDVLIPDRARSVLELAQERQLETFLGLVRTAELRHLFTDAGQLTVFVPSQQAFSESTSKLLEAARTDKEAARQLLLFHAIQGRHLSKGITDSQVVTSLDKENPLRLQVHRSALGVEDAIVQEADVQGQDGVLHVINRVLQPVTESAGDILRQRGGFSVFLQSMEKLMDSKVDDLTLHNKDGVCTFFVPNDAAFSALGEDTLHRIMGDVELLSQTVKNHISERMLTAGSFRPRLTYHVTTKHGAVDVRRHGRHMTVENARVLERDILSTNGVIHVIDKVLLPSSIRESLKVSGKMFQRLSRRQGAGQSRRTTISTSTRSERWHRRRRPGTSSSYHTKKSRRVHATV